VARLRLYTTSCQLDLFCSVDLVDALLYELKVRRRQLKLISSGKREWRYFRNLLLVTVLALLFAFYVVIPVYVANRTMHPTRFSVGSVSPADLGLEYEDVTLVTSDGLKLYGWYVPSQNGAAVIAIHAYNGNRTGVIYHAGLLAQHGYGVLFFDLRAHGHSEGDIFPFGWDADEDVFAALAYLQDRSDVDPQRIGVLGLSIGAEVALQAAADTSRIKAVVAEGSGGRTLEEWSIAPDPPGLINAPGCWVYFKTAELISGVPSSPPLTELTPQISPTPLLLISAGGDNELNRVYYAAANEPKALWERSEAGHIDALFAHPHEYEERVITFFDQALLESE